MPNWCGNSLKVIGEEKEIRRFFETGITISVEKNGELTETWSLEPYYPYPDGKWDYHWCVEHWEQNGMSMMKFMKLQKTNSQ